MYPESIRRLMKKSVFKAIKCSATFLDEEVPELKIAGRQEGVLEKNISLP